MLFCVNIKFHLLRKQGFFSFFFSCLQNNSENLWNVVLSGKWQSGMKKTKLHTTRVQINNIPSKSHVIPLLTGVWLCI